MKVLGIVGSKRKNGNTAYLVNKALDVIKSKEVETDVVYLGDYNFSGCNGCEACKDTYECIIKDDMQKIYPLLIEADALVIASPTYFYNVTSDIKAFIDRLYCFQVFADDDRSVWSSTIEAMGGKHALVIAICEQNNEEDMGFTAQAMTKPLEGLGYRIVETVKILNLYKKDEAMGNEHALGQVEKASWKLIKTLELKNKTKNRLNNIK